jgi:CheY-like chemotaxis protein
MDISPSISSQACIMVVDDESYIVRMMELLLKKHGYNLLGYIDPVEALERFELEIEKIQLVISDIRMPSMN